jgi:Rieske Fe-S protein
LDPAIAWTRIIVREAEVAMTEQDREMTRRVLLRGAAVTGVAAPLLTACASDNGGSGSGAGDSGSGGSKSGSGSASAKAEVAVSDVPVDGGTILADKQVVVTQPAKDDFKAFSAVCTHQGCTVQTITDGRITCPCHGSQFSIEDGSVVQGPATQPLPAFKASVQGGTVTVS